jgi:hypothetical protein
MPIPKRTATESRDEFISRCMSDLSSEFPDRKQRAAVCYAQLSVHKGKKKS